MRLTRLRSLVGESRRNASTSPLRSFIHGAVLASVIVATALLDTLTIDGLERQAEAFRAAGGATRVLSSPDAVDRDRCEQLPTAAGFSASGSLAQRDSIVLLEPGSSTIPVYEISRGLAARLGIVDVGRGGVYLTTTFAAELGADRGSVLMTREGPLPVLGAFAPGPGDSGASRLSSALVAIVPATGTASECWADTWPASRDRDPLLLTALAPDAPSKETSIDPLNPVVGQEFTGAKAFVERTSRFAPTAAVVAALLLGVVYSLTRRLELASSLHAGASRAFVAGTMAVEAALIGLPALGVAGLGYGALAFVLGANPGSLPTALALSAGVVAALFVTGVISAASTVRESDLFALFKAR
ncbi:hypothetical protein [uncultured Leifsonia sp.]|uniref:hypothetical protein n=1 Tax=uncultured Leifsonia sp. TaxID=340359 RepID=UPI0025FA255E|nr:hypothetical protein [uncultured Leifsonia sp.]